MAFRFHKRVKLGKGFGVHISKSGITPSYRGKRGSLSSKGYSIRTGIPGLTYRKTFSKAKNSGCLVVLILLMIGVCVVSCSSTEDASYSSFCPTTSNCGCSNKNKAPCQADPCCRWVVGEGCRCN